MFYNAMRRKGWSPSEQDMEAVVAIHNGVNERAWSEVSSEGMPHCHALHKGFLYTLHTYDSTVMVGVQQQLSSSFLELAFASVFAC